ncbi:MAG: urease accessory protein UreH [Armatimonadota bacterium]|nr:urease accessory protein UreH [Armatimonadota bacterium]MDR7520648.1 urease accessory protein UreH [Armatimonadota bacterium]MDR7550394.1 urease accessory protein UreH [Armatimonadota bacterium]
MESPAVSMLALGFLLGMKHAMETDHVAAVATMAAEQRSVWRSSLVGVVWGIGHTAALLVAGMLILGLDLVITERMHLALEFLVGIMLVGLGWNGLRRAARDITLHRHIHVHGGERHAHLHLHVGGRETHEHRHLALPRRSFWVGLVHGLAGSGAVTVLVLATIPSIALGLGYILVFGLGSVVGMLVASAAIGLPIALTSSRIGLVHLRIQQAAGVVSVAVGTALVWEILRTALR